MIKDFIQRNAYYKNFEDLTQDFIDKNLVCINKYIEFNDDKKEIDKFYLAFYQRRVRGHISKFWSFYNADKVEEKYIQYTNFYLAVNDKVYLKSKYSPGESMTIELIKCNNNSTQILKAELYYSEFNINIFKSEFSISNLKNKLIIFNDILSPYAFLNVLN